MNKIKKTVPSLAAVASVLMAAVLVIGAAAAPDPFKGKWHSTDVDGSYQTLIIGGGPGSSYHVRYFDEGATVCAVDLSVAASAIGSLELAGDTISGTMPVRCLASPPYVYDAHSYFQYTLVGTTLVDVWGTEWTH